MADRFKIEKKGGYNIEETEAYILKLEAELDAFRKKEAAIANAIVSAEVSANDIKRNAEIEAKDLFQEIEFDLSVVKKVVEKEKQALADFCEEYDLIVKRYFTEKAEEMTAPLRDKISQMEVLLVDKEKLRLERVKERELKAVDMRQHAISENGAAQAIQATDAATSDGTGDQAAKDSFASTVFPSFLRNKQPTNVPFDKMGNGYTLDGISGNITVAAEGDSMEAGSGAVGAVAAAANMAVANAENAVDNAVNTSSDTVSNTVNNAENAVNGAVNHAVNNGVNAINNAVDTAVNAVDAEKKTESVADTSTNTAANADGEQNNGDPFKVLKDYF